MKSKLRITRSIYLLALFAMTIALTQWLSITKTRAAVITVVNTDNAGAGSLRQAILDANATILSTDTIVYAIPGAGVKTIILTSALPTISAPIIIDGWSQGGVGYTGPPLIELDGTSAGAGVSGLTITAGNSTVKGLVINRFSASGILLQTNGGNTIQGNRIGTNASGLADFGNGQTGVLISSSNNTVGGITPTPGTGPGNLISGNNSHGVSLAGLAATGNTVVGNIIGLDATGSAAVANSFGGVTVFGANNMVGGEASGARNIISGNLDVGVFLNGSSGSTVTGNFIGTNLFGTAALGNGNAGVKLTNAPNSMIGGTTTAARNVISGNNQNGISIFGSFDTLVQGNIIGLDANGVADITAGAVGVFIDSLSFRNTIGGPTATPGTAPGNVISGMGAHGVEINTTSSLGNTVAGNIIGLDATGAADRGNTLDGVLLINAPNNTIGGTTPTTGNIISGNNASGIHISGNAATGSLVQNNFIGSQMNPSLAAGNGSNGIFINFTSHDNTIGGGVGLGNTIAFNNLDGVHIESSAATQNAIFANSIHSNTQQGIDLGPDGVTANDPLDADTGPNRLQNFPMLTSAKSGNGTFVLGSLNSTPGATFTIEFFSSPSGDPSGNGEGQTFQGSLVVTTGADGNITLAHTLPNAVPISHMMSCTATNNATRDTSEFSPCQIVTGQSPTAVEFAAATAAGFEDGGVLVRWHTGLEVDNLGFNIYRDEAGKQTRVNRQLIAGSSLTVGQGIEVRSGFSYQWWDEGIADCGSRIVDCPHAQYWVESVDLNGASTWNGPFAVKQSQSKERPASVEQARGLASLGNTDSPSRQLEPLAGPSNPKRSSEASSKAGLTLGSSASVKIAVKQAGIYRITQPELVAAGLDPSVDPRKLQLLVDGREQAISVVGESDGRFDSADAVEFYGVGIDSPFTDSHNYFLTADKQPGQRIASVASFAKPNPGGSFPYTTERHDRTIYFSALLNGARENFFGSVLAAQPLNQSLTVQHPDSSSQDATLEVALQGVTNFPHSIVVELNGSTIGYATFNRQDHFVTQLAVSASLLREGANTVTLRTTGNGADVSLVDYLRLTYQHTLTADGGSLRFTAQAQQQVTIDGFTDKSIRVFDVTSPDELQELEGTIDEVRDGFTVSFQVQGSGQRTLLAITDAATKKPARVSLDSPSALRSSRNVAEFVIITHRDLINEAQLLKAAREAQGMSVAVVDIEDIYDEFSFGQKTPQALKDFLAYAKKYWRGPLRSVLLFGDASYDTKNYLGAGEFDLVPTKLIDTAFIEAASDDWVADFNGDGLVELAIGRLPVRNQTEAAAMIKKLVAYDQAKPSQEVLGVADQNDGYDFERAIDQLKDLVPANLRIVQVKRGQLGDASARAALLEAINRGQKLVSYSGHGSVNVWRGNVLTNPDASQLQNKERLSVFLMMNCLNGYFTDPTMDSLSEALLKAEGGAVAAWASSALTYPDSQTAMSQELYRQLFSNPGIRIGEAVVRAKALAVDIDVRQTWILFGDPTMQLK